MSKKGVLMLQNGIILGTRAGGRETKILLLPIHLSFLLIDNGNVWTFLYF